MLKNYWQRNFKRFRAWIVLRKTRLMSNRFTYATHCLLKKHSINLIMGEDVDKEKKLLYKYLVVVMFS